ncbi:hypothetical protein [Streptomyces sp. NBC_00083]|uniref:hypothetical protein n=1 Tax=Streptomyces sp. NBC_00083 TaxID=2975647 RepID=UPI00224F7C64|nr:hypothetical protein [Streptomyces sp. NBC_00083]MCX5385173.1 hypothetical protein [Streptomyces sp. NBC_00083]
MTMPGDDSTQRDRDEARRDRAQRSVQISGVTGSVSVGDHNTVHSTYHSGTADDEAHRQLLDAIVEFRAGLAQLVVNDRTRALDTELAGAEDEIRADGRAAPGRLARLGELLAGATSLTGLLASGEALVQRVHALIGG